MLDRRSFVKVAAGAAAGSVLGCDLLTYTARPSRMLSKIGLQLYTVRTLLEDDFAGTLRAVANAGYDEVEFHDYFGLGPQEVKDLLEQLQLEAPVSHVSLEALRRSIPGVIAEAQSYGHRSIVCPWLDPPERSSIETYRNLAVLFNEAGKASREAGLRFGWHNHDYELQPIDGIVPLELLLDETDPELVDFEIDLYWIRKGGSDPFTWFDRYPGRFRGATSRTWRPMARWRMSAQAPLTSEPSSPTPSRRASSTTSSSTTSPLTRLPQSRQATTIWHRSQAERASCVA